MKFRRYEPYLYPLMVIAVALVGAFGSRVDEWYFALPKPPGTPPSWVFGPVWTTLYVLIAYAGFTFMARERDASARRTFAALFVINMTTNAAWSYLFFTLHMPVVALVDILIVLGTTIALVAFAWRRRRTVALVLIPYAVWVAYATYLNTGFVIL